MYPLAIHLSLRLAKQCEECDWESPLFPRYDNVTADMNHTLTSRKEAQKNTGLVSAIWLYCLKAGWVAVHQNTWMTGFCWLHMCCCCLSVCCHSSFILVAQKCLKYLISTWWEIKYTQHGLKKLEFKGVFFILVLSVFSGRGSAECFVKAEGMISI